MKRNSTLILTITALIVTGIMLGACGQATPRQNNTVEQSPYSTTLNHGPEA